MTEFIAPVFTEFIWLLAGALLGLILGVYLMVQTLQEKATPPVLWGLPVGLVLIAVLGGGLGGLFNADLWTGTMAALLMRWLGVLAVLPFSGSLLLATGLMAALQGPRNFAVAGVVFAVAIGAAVLTYVEGSVGGNTVFGTARVVIYLCFGLLSAVVALGVGGSERQGRAAMIGSLVFPLVVGAVEGGERALVGTMALRHSVGLDTLAKRSEALPAMLGIVEEEASWGWAAVAVALAVPLLVHSAQQWRGAPRTALLALVVLVLPPMMLTVGLPDAAGMAAAIEFKASSTP